MIDNENPFYRTGLYFSCTKCSKCCRHEPGYVFLSRQDLNALANFFGITEKEVLDDYCRKIDIGGISRYSLREKNNYDCIFWETAGCTVYRARPLQCKTYPFWHQNLISREIWNGKKQECPGIGSGKKHSFREIKKYLQRRQSEPFLS